MGFSIMLWGAEKLLPLRYYRIVRSYMRLREIPDHKTHKGNNSEKGILPHTWSKMPPLRRQMPRQENLIDNKTNIIIKGIMHTRSFFKLYTSCVGMPKDDEIVYVCTRVGWKVHKLTKMQWSLLTKCGLFCNIVSPAVHTLLPPVLQYLDSCRIEALILIFKKSSTADITSSSVRYCFPAKCFFMLGNKKLSDVAKSGEYGGWSTSSKPQSRTAAIASLQPQTCVQEHCPGETGLPLSVFQAVHKMSLVLPFKVLNYLSIVGYLEGNNAVSIRKGWI